jgi:eukaryotic-like serine/threonine-protein kinase
VLQAPVQTAGAAGGVAVGRYRVFDEIARGGMAAVHVARLLGPSGFSRTVAVKRLHPVYAKDPEFSAMLVDEARLATRIRHPNVVSTIDFVEANDELLLVMEYVAGESLATLLRGADARERAPVAVAVRIAADVLRGLHAAHQATDDTGAAMHIVHRDVSPQNILVGSDGVARVLDFGIAKAVARMQITREGNVKGKLAYMSPEQIKSEPLDHRTDVFAAAVVLWEMLAGRRLFTADDPGVVALNVLGAPILPPSRFAPDVSEALDGVVLRGLSRDAGGRHATAEEMAAALEGAAAPAPPDAVSAWLRARAGAQLDERARRIAEIERSSAGALPARTGKARPALPGDGLEGLRHGEPDDGEMRARAEAATAILPADATFKERFDSAFDRPVEPTAGGRRRASLGLVALGALALAAAAFWYPWRPTSDPAAAASDAEAAPAATPAEVAPTTAAATSAASSAAAEAPAAASTPAATLDAPPTATAKAIAAPARAVPPADCNPPFEWDRERRIKVPKRHCFR